MPETSQIFELTSGICTGVLKDSDVDWLLIKLFFFYLDSWISFPFVLCSEQVVCAPVWLISLDIYFLRGCWWSFTIWLKLVAYYKSLHLHFHFPLHGFCMHAWKILSLSRDGFAPEPPTYTNALAILSQFSAPFRVKSFLS